MACTTRAPRPPISPRYDLAGYRVGNPTPMGRFWVYRVAQPGRPGCTGLCVWTPRPRCVCALGAPPPLPPPGMCTCGEIVDENPTRLAAPLSTTTLIVHRLALGWRKADSEKGARPFVGTTTGRRGKNPGWRKLPGRRNPAARNYRDRETRQLKSSGLNPAFQPGVPGCVWGCAEGRIS